MVHADQRIIAGPGQIFHVAFFAHNGNYRKVVYRKHKIISLVFKHLFQPVLKCLVPVIAFQFLLYDIHFMPHRQERFFYITIIVCLPFID